MARKTKQEALATRNLILDTAERVFQVGGVSRTSLHEVAQAAGLTRGAIYWHFQDKADLFDAMLQRVVLPMECSLDSGEASRAPSPLACLRESVVKAFRLAVHDPQVRRVFEIASHKTEYVDELQVVRDRRIAFREARLADLERIFAAAIALGHIGPQVPAPLAARAAHALVDGLMHNWLLDPSAFDLEQVGCVAFDTFLVGLADVRNQAARAHPSDPASTPAPPTARARSPRRR